MTAGDQLSSLSGLPSGTALAHLLAIQSGSGTGETIYTKSIYVTTEVQQCFVQALDKTTGADIPDSAPVGANEAGDQKSYAFPASRSLVVTLRKSRNTVKS